MPTRALRGFYFRARDQVEGFDPVDLAGWERTQYGLESLGHLAAVVSIRKLAALRARYLRYLLEADIGYTTAFRPIVSDISSSSAAAEGLLSRIKVTRYELLQVYQFLHGGLLLFGLLFIVGFGRLVDIAYSFVSELDARGLIGLMALIYVVAVVAKILSRIHEVCRYLFLMGVVVYAFLLSSSEGTAIQLPSAINFAVPKSFVDYLALLQFDFPYAARFGQSLIVATGVVIALTLFGSVARVVVVIVQSGLTRRIIGPQYAALMLLQAAQNLSSADFLHNLRLRNSTLRKLQKAARVVSEPGGELLNGLTRTEAALLEWRFKRSAEAIMWYRTWIVIPNAERSLSDAARSLKQMARTILCQSWDELPNIKEAGESSSWWRVAVRTIQQLFIAALPAGTLAALKLFGLQLDPGATTILVAVSAIWAAVTVLGVIDPNLNSRVSLIRDVYAMFRGKGD